MNQKELLIMSTKEVERVTTIQKIIDKKITQVIASQQLGLTVRQIKRLVKKYKQSGPLGLVSKQRGQPSNRKFTEEKIELIKELVETHYYDFGPKFAAEKLYESHKITVSKETLRQWMIEWNLPQGEIQRDEIRFFGIHFLRTNGTQAKH